MAAYRNIYQFSIVSQNGDDVYIFISKKNYAGVVQQRPLGRAPILKRERSGNILGTSLEIYAECKVDGEFSQLYSSSADEFRVEVYRNRVLQWTGFVSPELYSEPDIAPPYDVQIIATDGLGELKNALFSQDLLSLHNHLNNILEHTGLILPIGIVSSLSWDDQQVNHSPYTLLTDTGIDLSNRIDDSCYDVLQDILRSLNACITQQAGGWLLIRESDLYDNIEKLSPVSFGSVNKAEWWPIGNLSSEIIPAKKRLTLVQENKYRENLLTPIYTGVAGGWDLTSGVFYDDIEKGYVIPSSSDSISYAIDFRSYPLQTQLRLTLRARSISLDDARDEASEMSLTIMMAGMINRKSGVYYLTPDFLSDNDRTQMKWFGGDKLGFIQSWDAPRAPGGELAIQDIEIIIPLYNDGVDKYAAADQLTIKISNAPNSPYRLCIYDAILKADQQYPGVKVMADIANDAREETSEIKVAMATSPDPMLEATMYGRLNGDGGIVNIYTPANSASDLLSFLVRDYAMQVALPRMRYRGKLNVPSMAHPVIPMIFERDSTYYFLNTYSYDLLNDELEVELVSIPNASVIIESETVTELPSVGSASGSSSGSGSSGGGGGSSTLAGLSDVQVGDAQNGQALVYENGYWVPRTVSGGGALTSDTIISALGYTPFDSDSFTKLNIKNALGIADWALAAKKPSYTWTEIGSRPTVLSAFTNDLGLGSLAYKSSLVASDIPSLPWSKITSGKPTTLSGYGITDAYTKTDADAKFLQQAGGTITGDVIVSTKLTSTVIEALQFKADGKLIMHRNVGAANFCLNYGGASEPMYLYGSEYGFHIGASRERVFSIFSNKDASFAANLTVAGGMYSKNLPQGKVFYQDPTSSFISTMFDTDAVGDSIFRIRVTRTGTEYDGICSPYSTILVVKSTDTHGYISFGYNDYGRAHCYIGGGNADKINWSGILFHNNMHLLPKTDITYDLGEPSYRWKGVYANNLYASSLYGPKPSGGSFNQYRMIYSEGRLYLQAGSNDGATTAGIVTISGINVAALTEFHVFAKYSLFTGDTQVNGASRFVSLATFDNGLKIGDATLTWDATARMLKIDKGVYSIGAITAGGKGQSNKYRLDNWTEWDASDNKWQESSLSAKLGVDLHTRLLAIEESTNIGPVKIDLEYIRNTTTLTPSQALAAGLTEDVINNMLAGRYTKVIPDNDAKEVWDYTADGSGNSISIYLTNGDGFTLKSGIVIHRNSITDNWSVTYDEI